MNQEDAGLEKEAIRALSGTSEASDINHEEEVIEVELDKNHPEDLIFYILIALVVGIFVLFLVNSKFSQRYHLKVYLPYTVLCFVGAFIFGILERTAGLGDQLGGSIREWLTADPHLILFVFLPPLLFNDSMALDIHLWSKKLLQCLVLAFPGVLVGTVLTGLVVKYLRPEWAFTLCLVLGSILSATDPVAVVALLKSLGAPKELTMVITGRFKSYFIFTSIRIQLT